MHRRVRWILEICRGKRAELGCVSLKQKQVLMFLTIRKNKITSHCTSWGPLKRGCREAQHPCSSLCTLTTIHAETSKPMSPKLIPSSLGDKASLDSRSPPSSQKKKTDFKVPCVEAPRVCLARAWQCFLPLLCQRCCVSLPALSPANAGHPASSTPSLRTTLLCLKQPGAQHINTQLLFPPTLLCGSLSEKIGSCQHRLQLGQGSIFLQLRFEPQPYLYGKK